MLSLPWFTLFFVVIMYTKNNGSMFGFVLRIYVNSEVSLAQEPCV